MAAKRINVQRLFIGLIEHRDKLLRAIGREESVQDKQELRDRLVEAIADSTEVMIGEVLERFLREEFGLAPDHGDEGAE